MTPPPPPPLPPTSPSTPTTSTTTSPPSTPPPPSNRPLTDGVDLRLYSREVQAELDVAEGGAVDDLLQVAPELVQLHAHLVQCDGILQGMSGMLAGFQQDLGSISKEIEELQTKSVSMAVRLRNRKEAEASLFTFLQHTYIPQQLATQLIEGEINESYIASLHSLHHRILYVQQQLHHTASASPSPRHSQAVLDAIPALLRLKLKAVQRLRLFLLERVHALQKPKTNIQIKQKLLVKFRYFYEFLLYHTDATLLSQSSTLSSPLVPTLDVDLASELRLHYQQTMSHIYSHKFRQYLDSLQQLQQPSSVEKTDVLGSEESWMRVGMTGLFASKKSLRRHQPLLPAARPRVGAAGVERHHHPAHRGEGGQEVQLREAVPQQPAAAHGHGHERVRLHRGVLRRADGEGGR